MNRSSVVGWTALAWAAGFSYLGLASELPPLPGVEVWERVDLVGHFGASGLLAALVAAWLMLARLPDPGPAVVAAAVLTIVLGLTIEVVQMGRPGRTFELADAVANGIGAVVGAGIYAGVSGRGARPEVAALVVTGLGLVATVAVVVIAVGN